MKWNCIRLTWAGAGLALLAVLANPSARAQEAHDNVVIVLDASGSMTGKLPGTQITKMNAAKAALKEVLKNVPQSTRVGLLVFSAANVTNDWLYPLGPRDDTELLRAIDLPVPNSGTPLGRYIKKGADRLVEERARQFGYGTFRLLIVTDGEAEDRALVDRYTPEVIARGLTVDVIGVAMANTHTLAQKVHSYRAANDPASLRRALSEVFAEVGDSRTDAADTDVFAQIAPIPAAVASAALQALSTPNNHPIGTKPSASPTKANASATQPNTSAPTPKPQNLAPTPQASVPVVPQTQVSQPYMPHRRRSFPQWGVIALVIAVVFGVFRRMGRRS